MNLREKLGEKYYLACLIIEPDVKDSFHITTPSQNNTLEGLIFLPESFFCAKTTPKTACWDIKERLSVDFLYDSDGWFVKLFWAFPFMNTIKSGKRVEMKNLKKKK